MNGLSYILNTQIAIIVLYLLYIIAFRKKTAPILARIYLISIIPVSIILAAIKVKLPLLFSGLYQSINFFISSQFIEAGNDTSPVVIAPLENITLAEANVAQSSISAGEIFGYIYIIGLSLTILVTIFNLYRTLRMISVIDKSENEKYAFSFMGREYIGGNVENRFLQAIRIHESAHSQQYHHIDLIYMLICRNIFWFNPIVWHINYLLKEVHEYQADKKVIESGYSSSEYAQILIDAQIGDITPYIIHSFSYKSTKNRIIMLKNNPKSGYLRILYVIPVIATLFLVICCKNQQEADILLSPENISVEIAEQEIDNSEPVLFAFVETKPQFVNEVGVASDANEFSKWVNANLNYPEQARVQGIQGRVTMEFVVNKDGSVGDVKILRGVDKLLDDEAMRIVKSSPKWIPGADEDGNKVKVIYRFPVWFQLRGTSASSTANQSDNLVVKPAGTNTDSDAILFTFVETKPQFVDENGIVSDANSFSKWVNAKLEYPAQSKAQGVQGRVTIEFTVDTDGSVNNVKVLRGVEKLLDDEAVKIVKSSPKWIPGEQGGKPVKVIYRFPVVFKLH